MQHEDLYLLRQTYSLKHILLCFNGPFTQGLIEEIGVALTKYLQAENSASSSADVFAVYVEIAQNIQHYCAARNYDGLDSWATVVIIHKPDGHYEILAGNIVETADGHALGESIRTLAAQDKAQLKAAYKEQLRKPRGHGQGAGAGLGLIDIARKATAPFTCSLRSMDGSERSFFSLRVEI